MWPCPKRACSLLCYSILPLCLLSLPTAKIPVSCLGQGMHLGSYVFWGKYCHRAIICGKDPCLVRFSSIGKPPGSVLDGTAGISCREDPAALHDLLGPLRFLLFQTACHVSGQACSPGGTVGQGWGRLGLLPRGSRCCDSALCGGAGRAAVGVSAHARPQ